MWILGNKEKLFPFGQVDRREVQVQMALEAIWLRASLESSLGEVQISSDFTRK